MGMPSTEEVKTQIVQNRTVELEEAEIINVIASPVQYTADIAFDGELLWVNGYNEYVLNGLDPETGEIIETIDIDIQRPYGMTYKNGYFYIIDNNALEIVVIDRFTGETIETTALPQDNTYPTGLELIGEDYYYNDPTSPYAIIDGDITRKYDGLTESFTEYDAVGDFPSGIAFDGNYIWSTDNVSQILHQVDKNTLQPVRSIQAPGGIYPNGLTSDGEFLWISNNDADSIYKIRINEPEVNTSIASIDNDNQFKVYPTIATEQINIEIKSELNSDYSIEIVNINGKVIDQFTAEANYENANTWTIDPNLNTGIYFCRIQSEEGTISKKFIIQR
jgi:glutamine cyclotransferase